MYRVSRIIKYKPKASWLIQCCTTNNMIVREKTNKILEFIIYIVALNIFAQNVRGLCCTHSNSCLWQNTAWL